MRPPSVRPPVHKKRPAGNAAKVCPPGCLEADWQAYLSAIRTASIAFKRACGAPASEKARALAEHREAVLTAIALSLRIHPTTPNHHPFRSLPCPLSSYSADKADHRLTPTAAGTSWSSACSPLPSSPSRSPSISKDTLP